VTNAATTRQLVRKALQDAISIPDGGVSAQVTSQAAVAHAILDLASAIRELQPIANTALGPVNIDDREDDNPPAPGPQPHDGIHFEPAVDKRTTAQKIRDEMRGQKR